MLASLARALARLGAFVTFNCEVSARRCIHDYRFTGSWYYRTFQPFLLRVKPPANCADKTWKEPARIRVDAAPAPSLVNWENLHVSDGERWVRVAFTNLVTIVLLLVSFGLVYGANIASKQAAAMAPK